METVTNEKKKANFAWKLLLILVLFVLGAGFANAAYFKGSLPLGMLLMHGSFFIGLLSIFSPSKVKSNPSKHIIGLLAIAILFIFSGSQVVVSAYDLMKGPQEIVLEDADTMQRNERSGKYGRATVTYLTGKTEAGDTLKIRLRGNKKEKDVDAVLKTDDTVIVSYYKGLKTLYDIKKAK